MKFVKNKNLLFNLVENGWELKLKYISKTKKLLKA